MHTIQYEKGGKLYMVWEDDPEKFFRRPPHLISNADIFRWRACCDALREMTGEA